MGKVKAAGSNKALLLLFLVVIVAGVLPYLEVITKGFFLADDFTLLFRVRNMSVFQTLQVESGQVLFVRVLVYFIWKLEYIAFGFYPPYFYVVNVLVNSLSACLVFLIVEGFSENRGFGFLAGLAFAIFPLHPEAVSWLACQYDVWCAFFFLLALWSFGLFVRKGGGSWYLAAMLFFILSLFSKEMAVSLPPVLLLYDLFWGKSAGFARRLRVHLPFFLMLGFFLVLRLLTIGSLGGYRTPEGSSKHIIGPLKFLRTFFVDMPHDFLYPLNHSEFSGVTWVFWLGAALVIALLLYRLLVIKSGYKELAFALGFILISCLPIIGVLKVSSDLNGSRYLYLPSVGFCMFIAWLAVGVLPIKRFGAGVFAVAVLLSGFYGFVLYKNNLPWVGASYGSRTTYNDMNAIAGMSRKETLIFFVQYRDMYKGAYFLPYWFYGYGDMISTPEARVEVFPVRALQKTDGGPVTINGLRDVEVIMGPEYRYTWRHIADAEKMVGGRATGNPLGLNYALVRWDPEIERVVLIDSNFIGRAK